MSQGASIIDTSGDYDTVAFLGTFDPTKFYFAGMDTFTFWDDYGNPNYYVDVNKNFQGNVIERLSFSDGSVWTTSGDSIVQILGTSGDDTIYLTAHHDVFDAGDGNDTIYALERDDYVEGGNGFDHLYGEHGNDTLLGGADDDFLFGGIGDDILDGGTGKDVLEGNEGADTYIVDNAGDVVIEDANNGFDIVESSVSFILRKHSQHLEELYLKGSNDIDGTGNSLDNLIEGNSGNNVLNGAWGDDTLIGGAGNDTFADDDGADTMFGGAGDDVYRVDNSGDVIVELQSEGYDLVEASVSFKLRQFSQHLEHLILLGSNNLTGIGNELDNTLEGNSGNNTLDGAWGDDIIWGGDGDDTIFGNVGDDLKLDGGNGNDTIHGDEGNDTLYGRNDHDLLDGGLDNDIIYGGLGDDTLLGGDGDDLLWGEEGNDILNGGSGADRLFGGTGADVFVFDDPSQYDTIYDRVEDFTEADADVLDLSGLLATYNAATDDLSTFLDVSNNGIRTYIYLDQDGTAGQFTFEYAIRMDGVLWDNSNVGQLIADGTLIV